MWRSAISSEVRRAAESAPGRARGRSPVLWLVAAGLALAGAAECKVLLSVEEALALAFPGAAIERRTVYLSAAERARAAELAGSPIPNAIVYPYVATRGGALAGTVYFDTHKVRTLPETVMVAVDSLGRTRRVEVIAFDEPPDYLPRAAWYEQFASRGLAPELALGRAIRPVTGATLTARATTGAVRRVLALHRVLAERTAP